MSPRYFSYALSDFTLIPGCVRILSLVTFPLIGAFKACVKRLNSIARTAVVHRMLYESVHPSVRPPYPVSEIANNSFD